MEKFSAWRDPGTGVQPFLTPVPPQTTKSLADYGAAAFGVVVGILRSVVALVLLILFTMLRLVCIFFLPIPPLHRFLSWLVIAILGRIFLCLIGFWSISTYVASRKSRRADTRSTDKWSPGPGDIIVSNWASWVEILWLAVQYDPQFVLPVCVASTPSITQSSTPATPGRRTGTGSAQIATVSAARRQQILGFRTASLLEMIFATGHVPPYEISTSTITTTIEDIRAQSDRPLVVFPECTTSNGRVLIRFADVFIAGKGKHIKHPVKGFKMFIVCARYDPPTSTTPSPTQSIPSQPGTLPNPLPHILKLLFAPAFTQSLSIRMVAPSDSPSSGSFMASEIILDNGIAPADEISEACAVLMAQASKLKRVGMGWEDKAAFLDFYRKRKSL
ncbi:acyltransferase-like protein, putative [Rhizoctonia solani AG-3 Rhs1AP]|uniref:Acyltransferase-like protein, putative n=1 Tax=Rhizoctonia solani AG-3 Rhs1AP TaxID=1086054 RepID=X8JRL5_9AGAM|nr:acyltransferase-like protein, putative [Rhizoctonia solani AG-3 Rhs1AP]